MALQFPSWHGVAEWQPQRWLFALLAAALAMSCRGLLDPWLGTALPFVFALPVVFAVGWLAGNGPAALATGACAAWLLAPQLAPTLHLAAGWRPIFYFLPSALLLGFLGSRLRHGGAQALSPRPQGPALAWLWAATVLGGAVPLALFAVVAITLYQGALAEGNLRVERAARIGEEHALKVFETNLSLINRSLDALGDESDTALRQREPQLHAQLQRMAADLPQLQGVFVIGADGRMVATNRVFPAPRQIDFSDRPAFSHHRAGGPQPYLSEVLTSRTTGEPFFDLSVRRKHRDGTFGGTVSTSLSPAYFAAFYRDIAGDKAPLSISLRRADGVLLAGWPQLPQARDAQAGNVGTGTGTAASADAGPAAAAAAPATNEPRAADSPGSSLRASRGLSPYPLMVTAEMDRRTALAPWYDQMLLMLALIFPTGGSLVYFSWLALQRTRHALEVADTLRQETESRKQVEASLRQSQKMEAVGQLTGGIAHDFNNLLQVITANLHLLGKDLGAQPALQRRLAHAREAVQRGAKLASQLLAFGRRQPLDPKVIHVGKLVLGMEDLLRRTLGDAVDVEVVASAGLWNTHVDPSQMENALLNLALNGRDAMGGAGKLTIEVSNSSLDDAYAQQHSELKPGQYVLMAVSDTGAGMTAEVAAQAFEPFFTTKPQGSGTGLGLSMVYGFVKQSGGHAKIYSEPGHGTTVKLYLPRSLSAEETRRQPLAQAMSGGSECILVVEDDAAVRDSAVEMLRELGYRVLHAGSADAAMKVIDSGQQIDLLFTDVVMPGAMRSTELASRARECLPALAVLFTSGYSRNAIVHGGRLDAGVDLLSKPYTSQQLAQRVRAVLAARPGGASPPPRETAMTQADNGAQGSEVLPGSMSPAVDERSLSARALRSPRVHAHVLLVEDDEFIRLSTAEMMRELGHTVFEAGSAEEALSLLRNPAIDVLVADIGLPGMSGDVFAAEVRGQRPTIGIVFATGANIVQHDPPVLGGPLLLRKPYDLAAIDEALRKALSQA